MGNDSPPHLSSNLQIKVPKHILRSDMGLLNTLQEEISKVMGRILSNPEMSPEQRDRLMRLQDDLSAGNLRTAGMTRDKMEKLMALRRAMEVSWCTKE